MILELKYKQFSETCSAIDEDIRKKHYSEDIKFHSYNGISGNAEQKVISLEMISIN